MSNIARLLLLSLAAMLLASCASTASFNYAIIPGSIPRYDPLPAEISIAVLPFQDKRIRYLEADGSSQDERGSYAAGWIPLMPYGWVEKVFPEQNRGNRFATLTSYWCQFDRELSQAAVTSLEYCQLFSQVRRVETSEQADTDWILRGYYTLTEYQGERLTYGLTYLGAWPLWLIGFPCAVSHCRLALDFDIVERATGKILWRLAYNDADFLVQGFYYNYGEDTQRFTKLANYAMGAAIFDLKNRIDQQQQKKTDDGFVIIQ